MGFSSEEYATTTVPILQASSKSAIAEAESVLHSKIHTLLNNIKRKNKWSPQRDESILATIPRHIDPSQLPQLPPSPTEKLKSRNTKDPLLQYIAQAKQNKSTATSPPQSISKSMKQSRVDPVVASRSKTIVQSVIGGVPSGFCHNDRGSIAEAKHLSRMLPTYTGTITRFPDTSLDETKLLEQYHDEQSLKTNLVSTLENFVTWMMGIDTDRAKMMIDDVQNILDCSAEREQEVFEILERYEVGPERYKLLFLKLTMERNDTQKLKDIVDQEFITSTGKKSPSLNSNETKPESILETTDAGMDRTKESHNISIDNELIVDSIPPPPPVPPSSNDLSTVHQGDHAYVQSTKTTDEIWRVAENEMLKTARGSDQAHEFAEKDLLFRISKAIAKITNLIGRENGRKRICANVNALPALAATLERLADLDVTPRKSGPRYEHKNEKTYTRYAKAEEVIDRCLNIIGWCESTIRYNDKSSSRNERKIDLDMKILQLQWEFMDSCV